MHARKETSARNVGSEVSQTQCHMTRHVHFLTSYWELGRGRRDLVRLNETMRVDSARPGAHVLPQETRWQTARCRHSGMSALSNHTPLLDYLLVKTSLHVSACCWNVRTRMERTSGKDLRSFPMGPNQTERLCGIRARSTWKGWGCEGAQGTWRQVRGGESSA